MAAELFHAEGRTYGRTVGEADMEKLTVAAVTLH
jgi:hypothetical protein